MSCSWSNHIVLLLMFVTEKVPLLLVISLTVKEHARLGSCYRKHLFAGRPFTQAKSSPACAGPWWRHQMEIFSALLAICAGNSPVSGEFPAKRPATRSFDVFFDLCLNKRLGKQSRGWWFETLYRPLWRHCNDVTQGTPLRRLRKVMFEIWQTNWQVVFIGSSSSLKNCCDNSTVLSMQLEAQ